MSFKLLTTNITTMNAIVKANTMRGSSEGPPLDVSAKLRMPAIPDGVRTRSSAIVSF